MTPTPHTDREALKPYPSAVCSQCATSAGAAIPNGHQPTMWIGHCDVCGFDKSVTSPRDFRYPKFEGFGE